MSIEISDPLYQTQVFSVIMIGILLISISKDRATGAFSKDVTNQLKGFAILAVIFSHIGYFLYADSKFLYPWSITAGVGVNVFLFLSGFGLTSSYLKRPISIVEYYKKRLLKLYSPMWSVISILLLADFFILHKLYPTKEIIYSFLGFFPRADIAINLDSPLWYFSLILFYYLIFPVVFIKKFPILTPILVLLISMGFLYLPLPVDIDVLKLYKLHYLAFPLGIFFALTYKIFLFNLNRLLSVLVLLASIILFICTAVYSGVGQTPQTEQNISLLSTLLLIVIFSLIRFKFRLLSWFGIYSYEIYLLHWPILSRYNIFLNLPPAISVFLNIGLILLLGIGLQRLKLSNLRAFLGLDKH